MINEAFKAGKVCSVCAVVQRLEDHSINIILIGGDGFSIIINNFVAQFWSLGQKYLLVALESAMDLTSLFKLYVNGFTIKHVNNVAMQLSLHLFLPSFYINPHCHSKL